MYWRRECFFETWVGGIYLCLCVCVWERHKQYVDWMHSSSPLLSIDLQISLLHIHPITAALPERQPNKLGYRAAQTRPRPFIAERLPVTLSGPHPNQPSSPADNALWKPSPWELLHMLWVVVKETWLNNVPSSLMHRLASLRLTHLFCACVPVMWK